MDKSTTNQVRQILMNELGLTRESIREIVEQIVIETVDKHMSSLETSGQLDKIVENAFVSRYRDKDNCYARFKDLIEEAAQEAAHKFVKENVKISTKK